MPLLTGPQHKLWEGHAQHNCVSLMGAACLAMHDVRHAFGCITDKQVSRKFPHQHWSLMRRWFH